MKKILLLLTVCTAVSSVYITKAQGESAFKGGGNGMHEARFTVFDNLSHKPVANAGVYKDTDQVLGTTDQKGFLTLSLPASESTVYTVKSAGFAPITMRLTQANKRSANYEVFLQPSAQTSAPDLVKVYVKQDPATIERVQEQEPSNVEFAVQLSATSRPITDKTSFQTWEELGPVYIHVENGLYKVRIGPYQTQEAAKAILLKAKARGKSDAFIVVQQGIENHVPFDPEVHAAKNSSTEQPTEGTVHTSTTPATTPSSTMEEVQGDYKVRLASYLHPGAFNPKDIDQLGPLESYRKGEWTIMMIGGFKTKSEADRVKQIVIGKGYSDAAVIIDQDGILMETE